MFLIPLGALEADGEFELHGDLTHGVRELGCLYTDSHQLLGAASVPWG